MAQAKRKHRGDGVEVPNPRRVDNICGAPKDRLQGMLLLPHHGSVGGQRYYRAKKGSCEWLSYKELVADVDNEKVDNTTSKRVLLKQTECLIVSVSGKPPCRDEACLLQVYWRPRSNTDRYVIRQLLEGDGYDRLEGHNFKSILDAGANIGLASIMFATMWPDAAIAAVEPSSSNVDVLHKNVEHLPHVKVFRGAVWSSRPSKNKLVLLDTGLENGVTVVDLRKAPKGLYESVPGMTVQEIAGQRNVDHFDLVKFDIEGAEQEVFTALVPSVIWKATDDASWLDHAEVVTVEVHEGQKGKRMTSAEAVDKVFNARSAEFSREKSDEYLIFERKMPGIG
eukprot:SM000082S22886  [mRNA]  locus=s82:476686:478286:- [translate_table: standard]